jgi:hypothetical protein
MLRTGMAVMAAGLVLLSGCTSTKDKPGSATPSGSSSAAAAADDANAVAALNAAQQKTRAASYHTDVTLKTAGTTSDISANVDPQAKALEMTMDMQGTKLTVRLIGTDMYMTGLTGASGKWVHADISKLPGVDAILLSFDQTFALMDGATDLKEDPKGTFTGSVDPKAALGKAQTDSQKDALNKIISASGQGKLPFTAKVVDGYLVETTTSYKMDQGGTSTESTIISKFSQFGTAPKVTAPAKADIIATP